MRGNSMGSYFIFIMAGLVLVVQATTPTHQSDASPLNQQPPKTDQKKRAEEVLMFGNQQNKLVGNIADALAAGYFPALDKKDSNSSGKHNETSPVVETSTSSTSGNKMTLNSQHSLPEHSQQFGSGLRDVKTGFYSSFPEQWQEVYFNGYDRAKRGGGLAKRTPLIRREFQTMLPDLLRAQQNGRFKRDLNLDRGDIAALLSLLEADRIQPKYRYPKRNVFRYGDDYENYEDEDSDGEDNKGQFVWPNSEDAVIREDEWDDAPYSHFGMIRRSPFGPLHPILPKVDLRPVIFAPQKRATWQDQPTRFPSGRWGIFPERKRFMVTKKRQIRVEPNGLYSLSQLLRDNQKVDEEIPVYRRFVL